MTRSRTHVLTALASLALAGCGGYAPEHGESTAGGRAIRSAGGDAPERAPEPEGTVDDYEARIAELQQELAGHFPPQRGAHGYGGAEELASEALEESDSASPAQAPGPPPPRTPCEAGADLRDRICELAERICRIAGEHPEDAELVGKCEAATAACQDARADVEAACPAP